MAKIIGQVLTIILLTYFMFQLLSIPRPYTFLDYANFPIHELGHFIFIFFGEFMNISGGSLFQCLVPLMFLIYFFYTKQFFATGFSTFWLGNNVISVSVYMKDARTMTLQLIGGDIHDWNALFTKMGLLQYDQLIGGVFFSIGAIILILGYSFCIGVVVKDFIDNK